MRKQLKFRRTLVLIIIALILCGTGYGQTVDSEQLQIARKPPPPPKSSGRAVLMSATATLIPISVGMLIEGGNKGNDGGSFHVSSLAYLSGIIIGPGSGYLYATDQKSFLQGVALRAAGCGLYLLGDEMESDPSSSGTFAQSLVVGGLMIAAFGTLVDIVGSGDSVRKYNEGENFTSISLTPYYATKNNSAGLRVAVNF